MTIVFLLGGLGLLVAGGEVLIRGATGLASWARVSPTVIGLTVVAAGTSMPELVVSVQAALDQVTAVAVGNVVGSNIFNAAAILGAAAVLAPLQIQGNVVRLEYPVMAISAVQMLLLCRDGQLDRLEGAFFLGCLVAYVAYGVWSAKKGATVEERTQFEEFVPQKRLALPTWSLQGGWVGVGVALLVGGSNLLVSGAVDLGRILGISEATIGLTVVAAGTSLPELATSCVASLRGKADIAVANVIGSNIYNVLGIAGTTALIYPLPVPEPILVRDLWWMVGVSLLLFPLLKSGLRVTRLEGVLLLGGFAVYLGVLLSGSSRF